MDTLVGTPPASVPAALRRLYFLRFAFAAAWAALLFATAETLGALTATLLVIYPLFDVACAVVDLRSAPDERRTRTCPVREHRAQRPHRHRPGRRRHLSGIPAVLRVWGAWAITAGIVQLVVGVARRRLGGQGAMIAGGGISTLAGASFIAQAGRTEPP